jgi:hypothetical protein
VIGDNQIDPIASLLRLEIMGVIFTDAEECHAGVAVPL